MKRFFVVLATSLVVTLAAGAGVALGSLAADIEETGTILGGGKAVLVGVTVTCDSGSGVLEAFVYVVQDGNNSPFAGIPVRCTGKAHTYRVQVPAPSGAEFHPGAARVSGYVLLSSGQSISPTREIELR